MDEVAKLPEPVAFKAYGRALEWVFFDGTIETSRQSLYRARKKGGSRDGIAAVFPITVEYAGVQAGLPQHHRAPFDRLLVAQAMVENVPIISADAVFDRYGLSRIW